MGVEAHQSWHDKPTSDCRSYGSNVHPSSQSRKISIGILVDSAANTRYGIMKRGQLIMPNTERTTSNAGTFSGEKCKIKGVTASFNMKQTGGPEEVKCSRITRSLYQKTPISENILRANLMEKSNLPVSSGRQDEPDGVEFAPAKYSVPQCSKQQTPVFHSSDCKQKLDGFTRKGEGMKDGTTKGVEEFTFGTALEVSKSDKAKQEGKINNKENRTEKLRTKLCEILGTTSSPKGSQTRNMDGESLLPDQPFDKKGGGFVKTRQNSDTIETDSENLDHADKRPITRSLRRKRASTKIRPTKCKRGPSSREKYQEKNIFHFEERWTAMESAFRAGGSLMPSSMKSHRESSRTGSLKICSPENDDGDKLCQENSRTDIRPQNEETFSLGNEIIGFQGGLSDRQKNCHQTVLLSQEKEFCQSPTKNKIDHHGEREGSANGKQEEDRNTPVVENVSDLQDNFQSPSFRLTKPTFGSTSPCLTPKTDHIVNAVSSPASSERSFSLGAIRNLRTFQIMEPDCGRLGAQRLSSDTEEFKDSFPRKSASFVKENEEEDGSSDSLSEDKKSKGSQEGSRKRDCAGKQTAILYPIKRLRSHDDIKFSGGGLASPSSKGIGENDWIREASDQNLKDGFSRAVGLFALELGRLKCKLKSMTSQKTSEILTCVVEEINTQLQNVHSQIQTDIGKLTSQSKSKRKRLEQKFEDHQRQLRLIHERFKEEVNLHLQDCRSTVEGLEADQIEIMGAMEKQKVSHKKLLSEVEAAVETQLNDAQRKITAIQELARGKLLQLKHVMAMCMKEGILN